jgi:hypothetical protein
VKAATAQVVTAVAVAVADLTALTGCVGSHDSHAMNSREGGRSLADPGDAGTVTGLLFREISGL